MNIRPIYPCPCCGFETFSEPPGSYEICVVCGWEDDLVQLMHPSMGGGANRKSLLEAQAGSLLAHPVEVQVQAGFKRAGKWRPLLVRDLKEQDSPSSGIQYFGAAAEEGARYYWES